MKRKTDRQFAVIGIGAFGEALARKLGEEGAYVIAIDTNMDHINRVKDHVSDAICFDATDSDLLEDHGITNVDVAIIAIGERFEPVVLIAMQLLNAGVKEIYGRAGSRTQEQILEHIGITDVIHPERQVAERMGVSLTRGGMTDMFDLADNLSVFEIEAPESMVGYTLQELELRKRYQLNLITIKRLGSSPGRVGPDRKYESIGILDGNTTVREGDRFLLVGSQENADKMLETN